MLARRIIAAVVMSAVLAGCTSTTTIYSKPIGAKAVIDGKKTLGRTPIQLEEDVWLWTSHTVELSKEGYGTERIRIQSDGLNAAYLAVCVCSLGLLLPIMFVSSYPRQYVVELTPAKPEAPADGKLEEQASIEFQ